MSSVPSSYPSPPPQRWSEPAPGHEMLLIVAGIVLSFLDFGAVPLVIIGFPLIVIGVINRWRHRDAWRAFKERRDDLEKAWSRYHEEVANYSNQIVREGTHTDLAKWMLHPTDVVVAFAPQLPSADIGKALVKRREPYQEGETMLAWFPDGTETSALLVSDRTVYFGRSGDWWVDSYGIESAPFVISVRGLNPYSVVMSDEKDLKFGGGKFTKEGARSIARLVRSMVPRYSGPLCTQCGSSDLEAFFSALTEAVQDIKGGFFGGLLSSVGGVDPTLAKAVGVGQARRSANAALRFHCLNCDHKSRDTVWPTLVNKVPRSPAQPSGADASRK